MTSCRKENSLLQITKTTELPCLVGSERRRSAPGRSRDVRARPEGARSQNFVSPHHYIRRGDIVFDVRIIIILIITPNNKIYCDTHVINIFIIQWPVPINNHNDLYAAPLYRRIIALLLWSSSSPLRGVVLLTIFSSPVRPSLSSDRGGRTRCPRGLLGAFVRRVITLTIIITRSGQGFTRTTATKNCLPRQNHVSSPDVENWSWKINRKIHSIESI